MASANWENDQQPRSKTTGEKPTDDGILIPLSWSYARARFRHILQNYVDDFATRRRSDGASSKNGNQEGIDNKRSFIQWCIDKNLDLHAGSLLVSVALLVLSSFSLSISNTERASALNATAQSSVYSSQVVAAAILLCLGTLLSIWIVRRTTRLRADDCDRAKKHEIVQFLRQSRGLEAKVEAATGVWDGPNLTDPTTNLAETALNDIYPVYRQVSVDPARFVWTRLPSLLLVEGDIIAMQVGDTAPADCTMLQSPQVAIPIGEHVTLDSLNDTTSTLLSELPDGRTTLPFVPEHLMLLCNNMHLFRVEKAPIEDFISRPASPPKPSIILRNIAPLRALLFAMVGTFIILTAAIILSRPKSTQADLSLTLPLPFLAALGVSPFVAPMLLFMLEVLGTARILQSVHPHAAKSPDLNGATVAENGTVIFDYIVATTMTRLSLWSIISALEKWWNSTKTTNRAPLLRVPPASFNLLETLGVCTAFALVDDELAYELNAIPQQLLIPSGHGLKLFDICPVYDDDDSKDLSGSESLPAHKNHGRSFDDSDSEAEGEPFYSTLRQKILKRRHLRRRKAVHSARNDETSVDTLQDSSELSIEVQFEDPSWWQHLPALKCVGLSCLVLEDSKLSTLQQHQHAETKARNSIDAAKLSLVNLITLERQCNQYVALAECIGISQEPNANGSRGDLTPFEVQMRFQVIDKSLFLERMSLDAHERSSENSRWWGSLRADATCVVVKDKRTGAYQMLTVGDPQVVANLCNEAWQGEISTILPLGQTDRKTIVETSVNWKLADLDVSAFGYAPVPHNLEKRLCKEDSESQVFLLDSTSGHAPSILKDKTASVDWNQVRNQVFVGVLGSLVVPRPQITTLLGVLSDAGVRFVYFSPRNMRRQKELAAQMGIDVAWNCAISLRPLDAGQEDPHRMMSTYADWDVNARLPHGVEEVRGHLEQVDNVPLLVSLYTDTTKTRTKDMVGIFQEYHDTVLAIGIAHLPRNSGIFAEADIAIGVDVLGGRKALSEDRSSAASITPLTRMMVAELEFATTIASQSCAFHFVGVSSLSSLSLIIQEARAALEACTSAALLFLSSSLSFSFFVFFSACAPSTTVPYIPMVGAVLYLQFLLPLVCFSMAFTTADEKLMKQVPPKKDAYRLFNPSQGLFPYKILFLKAIIVAILPQILHLIVFGELIIHLEPEMIRSECGGADVWYRVIRCDALRDYSGAARISSGIVVLAIFVLCSMVSSVCYIKRLDPITYQELWKSNKIGVIAVILAIASVVVATSLAVHDETGSALPWYFYVISALLPFVAVASNEMCKRLELKREVRAEKLRRLQFETRLGAWSPK